MALCTVQLASSTGQFSEMSKVSATKVLILGIDAASPELLLKWSAEGTLPNIANLMGRGLSGATNGLEGFFIGSTWPSIYTGASPASHGFHYLVQLKPGSYDYYRPADHGLFHSEPFWSALSKAGRRVAILDAPLSPLDPLLNGMQVLEWGGHDAIYGFMTQPAELIHDIRARFGEHPAGTKCDGSRNTARDYRTFVESLVHGAENKSALTRHFLSKGDWDLFMQVFSEAHCAGHQCWHLHDSSHPAYDPKIAATVGDPLRHVYQAIDTAIGQILEEAGDCMTFLFSSHGMSHWYGPQFLLTEILVQLGVAHRSEVTNQTETRESLATAALGWTWHRLPGSIRKSLAGVRQRFGPAINRVAGGPQTIDVDPGRSYCFGHRNGFAVGGIRLNLAGREAQGILKPGTEADAFCASLTRDLLDIVQEDSGQPLIRRVLRVSDHYSGPRLAELPDLLVEYNDAVPIGSTTIGKGRDATVRIRSPKTGRIEGTNTYGRTGEHRAQGLLIAAGPQVSPGTFDRSISVLDLAPTWTGILGVNLHQAEGTAIESLTPIT